MDLATAVRLSALCHEVYVGENSSSPAFTASDCCTDGEFPFHVLSDFNTVVLVFRGTRAEGSGVKRLGDWITQWWTSLNMGQSLVDGKYRVHRGFWKEITFVGASLAALLRDHGVSRKRFFVTGHSAGAALATLAARFLHDAKVATADAVYVYASPRVGDRRYAASYPLPLYRFETTDDLIPHFPPPPPFAPRNWEYVHAGRRFLIRRPTASSRFLVQHNARFYRDCLTQAVKLVKMAA